MGKVRSQDGHLKLRGDRGDVTTTVGTFLRLVDDEDEDDDCGAGEPRLGPGTGSAVRAEVVGPAVRGSRRPVSLDAFLKFLGPPQ